MNHAPLQLLLMVLTLLPLTSAATIHGEVYTYDLRLVTDSVLTINTTPEQIITLTQGNYRVDLPIGTYSMRIERVTPTELVFADEQIITIIDEQGSYRVDFLLFPQLLEEEELIITAPYQEQDTNTSTTLLLTGILIILATTLTLILIKRRIPRTQPLHDNDSQTVLAHIQKERRILQRDLRTLLPYSEAKLSLIITELESQGDIKKIKKGRGNILIYQGQQRSQTTSEQH